MMRKGWIIGGTVAVVVVAVVGIAGAVVASDLSSLRGDVNDIDYTLGDLENALRGAPSRSTLDTVHRRLDIARDDLRLLSLHHQLAMTFFNGETRAVWDRFGRVEEKWKTVSAR
jgi:hypothetical protein